MPLKVDEIKLKILQDEANLREVVTFVLENPTIINDELKDKIMKKLIEQEE